MKVNIIIKIQSCDDSEKVVEAKFPNCDMSELLYLTTENTTSKGMALMSPVIKQYYETYHGEVA